MKFRVCQRNSVFRFILLVLASGEKAPEVNQTTCLLFLGASTTRVGGSSKSRKKIKSPIDIKFILSVTSFLIPFGFLDPLPDILRHSQTLPPSLLCSF